MPKIIPTLYVPFHLLAGKFCGMRKQCSFLLVLATVLLLAPASQLRAQDSVRVMVYNLLRYGAQGINCSPTGVTARNAWFNTIVQNSMPDIFGCNEVGPFESATAPAENILLNVLQPHNPAYERLPVTFNGNQDIANAMFYNSDKIGFSHQGLINHGFRNIDYYKFYYKGPGLAQGDTTFIEVVLCHLAADNATTRETQTAAIMSHLDGFGRSGNFIVMGDMNMSGSGAQAYQNMVAHSNLDTRMRDPINLTGTWGNNSNADHAWSQSTRNSGSNDCGAGGGLDDRFDIILTSNSILNNDDNVRYIPGSYWVFGNPNAPNPSVSSAVDAALVPMSDHHPVIIDLEISKSVSRDPAHSQWSAAVLGAPVSDALHLQLQVPGGLEGAYAVSLLTIDGRQVFDRSYRLATGTQRLRLPATQLGSGVYFVRIRGPQGVLQTLKTVVLPK